MRHLRASSAIAVALAMALTCDSHAQTTPKPSGSSGPMTGIEFMTSTIMQEGQSSFAGLATRLRLHPSRLREEIEILPTIEWWRNRNTIESYDIRTTRKDATIGVDARWNFSGDTFRPYVGLGWGLHFLSSEVSAPSLGLVDADDALTKGGIAVLGGVSFMLTNKFDNFIDLKYHHVTDYRQFKINYGIGYNL